MVIYREKDGGHGGKDWRARGTLLSSSPFFTLP